MKLYYLTIVLLLLFINSSSAETWTVGSGGDAWDDNVTYNNTVNKSGINTLGALCDNFKGSSLNTSIWNVIAGGSYISVSGGKLHIDGGVNGGVSMRTVDQMPNSILITEIGGLEIITISAPANADTGVSYRDSSNYKFKTLWYQYATPWYIYKDGSGSFYSGTQVAAGNYTFVSHFNGSTLVAEVTGDITESKSVSYSSTPTEAFYVELHLAYGAGAPRPEKYIDYVWVKKYVDDDIGNTTTIIKDSVNIAAPNSNLNQTCWNGTNISVTNVSLYVNTSADQSSWTGWTLVQSNAISGTLYNVDVANQQRYFKIRAQQKGNNTLGPEIHNLSAIIITTALEPDITTFNPITPAWKNAGDPQEFNVTVDQTTNCTWYLNSVQIQYNTSATSHAYTNTSLVQGGWNFTAVVNNTNGTDVQIWWVAVDIMPNITSYAPPATIWPEVNDQQTFNVTVNQSTQCRWYINCSLVQTNSSLSTTHAYTNSSLEGGHWNFTAIVNNTNGTDSQTWIFEVGADSTSYIVLSEDDTNLSCLIKWNVTRVGSNVTHWNTSYSNTTAGYKYCNNYDNGTEILNQTATSDDETLWFNASTLLPTGIYYISVCESTPGISNVQNGSVSDTSQYVNWTVNQIANNRVIYDTGAVSADSTACDGQWSATHACANASDGNWSSYAESAGALLAYAYFNYTIPSAANRSESLWHVKDNAGQANLTIPSACWGSTLYLRATCSDIGNSATWQCDNGPGWTTLRTSVANIIYEEEMTFKYTSAWNNSTAAPNITLTGLTASTTYNFHARSYNLANASLSGNSSTYSFTTAAAAPYNYIYTGADEYIGFNNWSSDSTFLQIANNESNDVCYSYYNSTSGLWEAYRAGYTYNNAAIVPKNCSVFGFFDAETTIACTPNAGGITIQNASWFYGYLPGSAVQTVAQITASMDTDGLDVWAAYRWGNTTQTYNATGNVEPNEMVCVYVNTTGEWTP